MASKRHQRRKACNKRVYGNFAAAQWAAHHARVGQLEAYRCPHCGLFHIGHIVHRDSVNREEAKHRSRMLGSIFGD